MGLDCYVQKDVVKEDGTVESQDLWYGRKENEIHGWMQRHSGVAANKFNCERLYLTKELLDSLKTDLANRELPETHGFFFGGAGDHKQIALAVQALVTATRAALANGEQPYYYSWW